MPLIIWVAIAISIMLIGAGTGGGIFSALGHAFSGPLAYFSVIVVAVAIIIVLHGRSSR